jgi:hypothetical protein
MGLLSKAAVKMTEPAETVASAAPEGDIARELEKHFSANSSMQGIVLEIPPGFNAKKEGEDFGARVSRIVAIIGSALPLPPRAILTLFSGTSDRELIAHRLERSLNTKILTAFTAESVVEALKHIGPYR